MWSWGASLLSGFENGARKTRSLPYAFHLPHMPPVMRGQECQRPAQADDRRVDRLDNPEAPQVQTECAANRLRVAIASLMKLVHEPIRVNCRRGNSKRRSGNGHRYRWLDQ